jgi:hypothetical protein
MSPIEFNGEDIIIDGVPSRRLVESLKAAGLPDEAVVDLLGRMLAKEPVGARVAAAAAPFTFKTRISREAPDCAADYTRNFVHPDFFDGLTVVQAGETPEELGFNFRFHAIEEEFDLISTNLSRLSNCMAELRRQLFGMSVELEDKLTEIDKRLEALGKEKEKEKEGKEGKELKELKEKDAKEIKDKEKEGKETKDKDKDRKDGKEKERNDPPDKLQPAEKTRDQPPLRGPRGLAGPPPDQGSTGKKARSPGRPGTRGVFIRPEERPAVGQEALRATGEGG